MTWTLTAHRQAVLRERVYDANGNWTGNYKPWNLPYVCWAKRRDGNVIRIFNTEGRTSQEATEKASRRVG